MPYLVNNAYQHLKLMNQRTPVKQVIEDPSTSDETKRKLRLAQDARQYAEQQLGLKPTQNYTSFVELNRPYITYVVSVSPKDKLEYKKWSFPFVGKVPYKGFFSKQEALDEANKFDKNKYDTYVRGASAYSTLGWFNDPILSSMMKYKDYDIVNLIIHETTHATLYIKDNADFNERLASYVGNKGTELFYKSKEGPLSPTVIKLSEDQKDEKIFSEFISRETDKLKKWYEENKGKFSEEMRLSRLKEITERFKSEILPTLNTTQYKYFTQLQINNASLLSYKTYVYDLSDFEKAYLKNHENFNEFIEYCKTLESSTEPEKQLKQYIDDQNSMVN
ncbi:MAG: aminopeptidase [Bdellovibrionales bacterium]|nr:aminopeptidase [Bdellovibrionales bacterium]